MKFIKLDNSKIFSDLESIISRYLNSSYNSNTRSALFANYETIRSSKNQIEITINELKIRVQSQKQNFDIRRFDYRIPQTRCYITNLQNEDFTIKIFQYFDTIILLSDYYNIKSDLFIELSTSDNKLFTSYPKLIKTKENKYKIPNTSLLIVYVSKKTESKNLNPTEYIENCIKDEQDRHPLSQIRSQDLNFLSSLDDTWAKIKYVGKENQINVTMLVNEDIKNLIWLQELYIYFGWFDKLELFYSTLHSVDLDEPSASLFNICQTRFNNICKSLGKKSIDNKNLQDGQKARIEGNFLPAYLNWQQIVKSDINKKIQKTWNYLHIPAIQVVVDNKIYKNQDEFIAFALLCLTNQFWWYPKLEDKILQNLSIDKQFIFRFLTKIKKSNYILFGKESITISNFNVSSNVAEHRNVAATYTYKISRRSDESFTYLSKSNSFSLKINKNVDIDCSLKAKSIHIRPNLKYPIIKQSLESKLEISDYILHIPLIWNKFVIVFNSCRLKFLRKKDRYQVTIKFSQQIKQITLNDEIINHTNCSIQKSYIPIKRKESFTDFSIYNEYGGCTSKINSKGQRILLGGYAYDSYGILRTQFRLFFKDRKKSYIINTANLNEEPLTLMAGDREIIARADKFEQVEINYGFSDPVLINLAYTISIELFNRLKIFMNDQDIAVNEIRKICITNIGFTPDIRKISELKPEKRQIILIISDNYMNEKLNKDEKFRIVKVTDKSRQTALWISSKHIEYLFSETFFACIFN